MQNICGYAEHWPVDPDAPSPPKKRLGSGAEFSEDRRYRYALWRIWNDDKPIIMFIGLNPSTANEIKDDPTIRRVMRFAGDNGYGGFFMMNLFAYVSTDPAALATEPDPVGDNDSWLERIAREVDAVCFVWGAFAEGKRRTVVRERANLVKTKFPGALCLGRTASGHPSHPLYLPATSTMISFNPSINSL